MVLINGGGEKNDKKAFILFIEPINDYQSYQYNKHKILLNLFGIFYFLTINIFY
jgi:hypothetical protein